VVYREPHLHEAEDLDALRDLVHVTLVHEIAHFPDLSDGEGGSAPADGRDDAELAELGLAEKLGLRARGESPDDTGAQDVGPTR
ncbi:metallopeptidase family protein, partial [Clavibacter michiganensis]|uniref:metallopeptidase family protein n=1 Tax=Clavibacter michiganensis TaxID=28447 RepID=UPI00292E871B